MDALKEGAEEKSKKYVALVRLSRPIRPDDVAVIGAMADVRLEQKTPVRVLHRRAGLVVGPEEVLPCRKKLEKARVGWGGSLSGLELGHLFDPRGYRRVEMLANKLRRRDAAVVSVCLCFQIP